MDIKETMEFLAGIETTVIQYKAAMEDGSLGLFDIPKLLPIIRDMKTGLEGMGIMAAELKELDTAELEALIAKVSGIVAIIIDMLQPKE